MVRVSLVPLIVLVACDGGKNDQGTVPSTDHTGLDTTPTDTDTDTDTDTGDTETTPTGPVAFSELSWRLHESMGSLVVVSWEQDAASDVHVEYSVDPGEWLSSPVARSAAGPNERILVGIPFDHVAEWRVVDAGGNTVDGPTITTGPLPQGMPVPTVTVSDPSRWLPDSPYLLTSINERTGGWTGGTYWTFFLDRAGRVVWARRAPSSHWTLYATVARSGDHFLWDEATYWSDFGNGEEGKIHRTWLDEEKEVIDAPGLHHAWVELPDGTLVWGSKAHGGIEALVEKAPGAVDETVLWTCREDWPGAPDRWGQCESNGIFWVESTDSFLYSYYTNNSIVEVDHATGESLWWAGDVPGGYAFDPVESEFAWQHGITYTDTGTLLVSSEWDGGVGAPTHTWLLEYEVDPVNETLSLVWASDSGVKADTNGHAWRLGNGNTLHIVGSASVLREVDTAADEDVWRVEFPACNDPSSCRLLGGGEFVSDLYALLKPVE
jgi:hypothetical protein